MKKSEQNEAEAERAAGVVSKSAKPSAHSHESEASKKLGARTRNIGIQVTQPKEACNDVCCPFHGSIKLRGRTFVGKVIKEPFHKTATIEFARQFYLTKYERYEKRRTRLKVHIPPCLNVKKGHDIKIIETRPISKTKNFVVVEILK